MKPPVFRPAAAADVEEAYRWYEARRPGLGDEFLASVQAAVDSILGHPEGAPILRLVEGQVVVVACFHAKRDPRLWRARV